MNYIEIENEINKQLKELNSKYNSETQRLVKSIMVFIKAGERNLKHTRYGSLDVQGDIYYDVFLDYKRNDYIYIDFKYDANTAHGFHRASIKL